MCKNKYLCSTGMFQRSSMCKSGPLQMFASVQVGEVPTEHGDFQGAWRKGLAMWAEAAPRHLPQVSSDTENSDLWGKGRKKKEQATQQWQDCRATGIWAASLAELKEMQAARKLPGQISTTNCLSLKGSTNSISAGIGVSYSRQSDSAWVLGL